MRRLRGPSRREGGAVVIEFALVLPLLLLLVLGGIDWGYYFFVGQIAANAAREAARAAAAHPAGSTNPCEDYNPGMPTIPTPGAKRVAKNYMKAGGLIGSDDDSRLKGFDDPCPSTDGDGCCDAHKIIDGFPDELVQVTVRYELRPGSMSLTGFLRYPFLPPAVVSTATMRREP